MQTIVQMVKQANKLRKFIRTAPVEKIQRLAKQYLDPSYFAEDAIRPARAAIYTGIKRRFQASGRPAAAVQERIKKLVRKPAIAKSILKDSFSGTYRDLRSDPALANRVLSDHYSRRPKWAVFTLPEPVKASLQPKPGAVGRQLKYDPNRRVYRSLDTTPTYGSRFVTPHAEPVAAGYASGVSKTVNVAPEVAAVTRYPVKGLKFIAADKPGVPVYTPHIMSRDAEYIAGVAAGRVEPTIGGRNKTLGALKDYEGVVESLPERLGRHFLLNKQDKLWYPASMVKPEAKARAIAKQREQWLAPVV